MRDTRVVMVLLSPARRAARPAVAKLRFIMAGIDGYADGAPGGMEEGTCGREGAAVGLAHWQALNTSWARRRDDTAQKEESERGRARHVGKGPSMIAENDMHLLTLRAEGLTNPKRPKLPYWLTNCVNRFLSPGEGRDRRTRQAVHRGWGTEALPVRVSGRALYYARLFSADATGGAGEPSECGASVEVSQKYRGACRGAVERADSTSPSRLVSVRSRAVSQFYRGVRESKVCWTCMQIQRLIPGLSRPLQSRTVLRFR